MTTPAGTLQQPDGPVLPGMKCIRPIDSGGFADVYLYEQAQPRMRVAVKLMKSATLDEAKRRQFEAEADTMAELAEHPFIVPVLGAGTAPDGRPYLVMRYYPSSNLASRVSVAPMSVPEALRYGVQLSSAVETAHRAGIIHRDIKPANVLLSSYEQPGLSDFGIAGRPNDGGEAEDEMGVSIPWSPPEVLNGNSNGSIASDVYSLGATIWNLLVGRAPFYVPGGDNSERATVSRILNVKPPTTGRDDVPASLDRLLQQTLAKDPQMRSQSALELARHFQRIEQELRLARTEVVVLDQPSATLSSRDASPTTSEEPRRTGTATTRRTTLPDLSGPPPATPSEAAATARRAPVRAESVQTASEQWSTQPAIPANGSATPVKEARVKDSTSAPDEERDRPTAYRPRRVEPNRPASTPPAHETPRGRSKTLLIVTTLVVVGLVVGIGALLTHRPGNAAAHTHTSGSPSDTNLGDAAPTGNGPASPGRIRAVTSDHKVTFTWAAVSGATAYQWNPDSGSGGTVRKPRVTVTRSTSGPTCITVSSIKSGYPASLGKRACVR